MTPRSVVPDFPPCTLSLSLHEVLRHNDVETMLRNARITAQCDDGAEKRQEAVRQVHLAMYRAGLSQITAEEREQILEILRPCYPEVFIACPAEKDPVLGLGISREPVTDDSSASGQRSETG